MRCNKISLKKQLLIVCLFLVLLKLVILQCQKLRDIANDIIIPTEGQPQDIPDYFHDIQAAGITKLSDVFIGVKSTTKNHQTRLKLLLDTWISLARRNTWVFTDSNDTIFAAQFAESHWVDTPCPRSHKRRDLVCKSSKIFDTFESQLQKYRWLCMVDDDTYVNVPKLISLLAKYNHSSTIYIGKPSWTHPFLVNNLKNEEVWFATGGAGYCISRSLVLQMRPHTRGRRMRKLSDQTYLPDDMLVGYIITGLLKVELTRVAEFRSHLEGLWEFDLKTLDQQITLSYGPFALENKTIIHNVVNTNKMTPMFSVTEDPSRLKSVHCYLFPSINNCPVQNGSTS